MKHFLRGVGLAFLILLALPVTLWSFGAIHFDGPWSGLPNTLLTISWLSLLFWSLSRFRHPARRIAVFCGFWLVVLIPWLMKQPSNDREWPAETSRVASASMEGDVVTFTNFRSFDYEADGTPIERWVTRKFRLSELRGMDFFMTYWGERKRIGHPFFSFDFGPDGHVAFSIESRREIEETYSVFGGMYKCYELIYIVGDESDIVRSRTNFRENEHVYLYRLQIRPTTARLRFLEYIETLNQLAERPQFYNAVTANCTTAIRAQMKTGERHALDWRILFNGRLDELFMERNMFVEGIPFDELKRQSYINPAAQAHPGIEEFSQKIRKGLPGFAE